MCYVIRPGATIKPRAKISNKYVSNYIVYFPHISKYFVYIFLLLYLYFGDMYQDNSCPRQCGSLDTLQNLLTCAALQTYIKDDQKHIQHLDVYSSDMDQQRAAAILFTELLERRDLLLEDARQLGN